MSDAKSTTTNPPLTHDDLRKFTGDLERFRTINPIVIYTPGVEFLAERGQAYWLIDAIASYFGSEQMNSAIEHDSRVGWLQFWRLEVDKNRQAVLTARADSNVQPFITQRIPYTDFPLEYVDVWAGFDSERWTLYLPSEH